MGLSNSVIYFPGFRFAPPGALHHRPLCGLLHDSEAAIQEPIGTDVAMHNQG